MMKNHPFHLVTISPWPLILSFNLMNLLLSIILVMKFKINLIILPLITMMMILYQWWRDIVRESTYQGFHTLTVLKLMKLGMMLFIISELFFFISFFWTYFHASISPSIEIGMMWPPKNIITFNPYDIPLLNSIILISSGFTVTWSHNSLMENDLDATTLSLALTIVLGTYFSVLQIKEYAMASFCFHDSIYGSIFYMTTGFHGMHVNMGILFLTTCFYRMTGEHFSKIHHFNFEAASWYWHFVDIIWLFLYLSIYWWMY